jgi:hypothetical protein
MADHDDNFTLCAWKYREGARLLRSATEMVNPTLAQHFHNAEADAALEAADEWLSAQEALIAAKQISEEAEAEQEAVDVAGCRLATAVNQWRLRRVTDPEGAWAFRQSREEEERVPAGSPAPR